MTFDAENRLTAVTGGSTSASFVYAADGSRTVGAVNGVTTVYIGGIYEWQAGAATAYYAGPDGAVAFRRSGYATDNGVFYLLRDHLGSSSVIVDGSGNAVKRELYYPFGGNRGSAFSDLTSKRFTGQYHEEGLPGGEGLSYYNARWYDAQLGRFVSADTIVPNPVNPQDLNRLAYARNNPVRFQDPTGHYVFEESPDDPHYSVRRSGSGSSSRSGTTVSVRSKPQGQWARTGLSNSQYRRSQQQYNRYRANPQRYQNDMMAAAARNNAAFHRLGDADLFAQYVLRKNLDWAVRGDHFIVSEAFMAMVEPDAMAAYSMAPTIQLLRFTRSNFRKNLFRLTGEEYGFPVDAHHVLPVKFRSDFEKAGINIHDPRYGAWVERAEHRSWSRQYNLDWEEFFGKNSRPTIREIESHAVDLARRYKFDVNFK